VTAAELNFQDGVPLADMKIKVEGRATVWHVHRVAIASASAKVLTAAFLDEDGEYRNNGSAIEISVAAEYDDRTITAFLNCLYKERDQGGCDAYVKCWVERSSAAASGDSPRLRALLSLAKMAFQYNSAKILEDCTKILITGHSTILTVAIVDFLVMAQDVNLTRAYITTWISQKHDHNPDQKEAPTCGDAWGKIPSAFWTIVLDVCDAANTPARAAARCHFRMLQRGADLTVAQRARTIDRLAEYCAVTTRGHFKPSYLAKPVIDGYARSLPGAIAKLPCAGEFLVAYTNAIFKT
jgi:hypothetical protein